SMRRRVAFDVNARVRRKPDAGEPPAGVEVELTAIGPAGAPAIRRLFRGGDPPSTAVGLQQPPAALALLQTRVVREGPAAPRYAGLRGQAVVMPDEFQAGRRGIGRKPDVELVFVAGGKMHRVANGQARQGFAVAGDRQPARGAGGTQ